ncbi:30S ribosomal protein S17 [candidate division WWE3 bacterium RIFCSPHIGHO2_12_FULL_38_15]|uniref:Small ribosomal subunit protein uS17 n=1 Tax=candidate division WWE3 bacterium RIFCSPHIGHO2_02_FULL_38_14 TaxID=1802620 RepID=A0A1F4VCL2_UNCKA|nr:MAG: 30S ribosomal protein S17 [candidate division WWE3 bacterium RIFCSPHIGHO2_01_FULL_38_45]OGC49084.1 MAG: 30S ribosomal protein S17 [candidate division WWE3 bacterium RIFCSPHIGHO2_12_FULL_38_15]OGC53539.1 MAG: 30S ribosomal protein S17 [candidate division WWE3 bacterium RIFCSPLOWO2_01_FULL_37_24]OGC54443.1 MAG: 30S ribosomal protein S17 [candidate division WWE3 bacterium RIFCSPHIGHO2_02_FULL_38_14]HLB51689.1 30S ribosomal protein S17 [Patescibacteria group bacterium]
MPKKMFKGKIVSEKMNKTVIVAVEFPKRHPKYAKSIKNTKRFKARNEKNIKLGDIVLIEESRPYAKNVNWKVIEINPTKKEK